MGKYIHVHTKGRFRQYNNIFAFDYRVRLARIMTSQQIVLCKLDPRHSYDTLWMSQVKIVHVWMVESHDMLVAYNTKCCMQLACLVVRSKSA